jgi:acyl-CoA thioesterase
MTHNNELHTHELHREQILEYTRSDPFALSLGMDITRFEAGTVEAELTVQGHMVNAHGGLHGGVVYALADYAFSVACNSYGRTSVGLSTNMHFMATAKPGDRLVARATELRLGARTGFYRIDVLHGDTLIATMDAVAYRKDTYFVNIDPP